MAVFSNEGIGERGQFSHDGCQREFGLFSVGAKSAVEGFQVGIAADGGDGRHVQRLPDRGASALNAAQAPAPAGIVVEGRDAGKGCDFSRGEQPEFGQAGGERCGNNGTDAVDRGQDGITAFQAGIAFQQSMDGRIQFLDRACANIELTLQKPLENLAFGGAITVLEHRFIGLKRLPGQDKFLKSANILAGTGVALGLRLVP